MSPVTLPKVQKSQEDPWKQSVFSGTTSNCSNHIPTWKGRCCSMCYPSPCCDKAPMEATGRRICFHSQFWRVSIHLDGEDMTSSWEWLENRLRKGKRVGSNSEREAETERATVYMYACECGSQRSILALVLQALFILFFNYLRVSYMCVMHLIKCTPFPSLPYNLYHFSFPTACSLKKETPPLHPLSVPCMCKGVKPSA